MSHLVLKPLQIQTLREECGGIQKSEGTRVPHQIAPIGLQQGVFSTMDAILL